MPRPLPIFNEPVFLLLPSATPAKQDPFVLAAPLRPRPANPLGSLGIKPFPRIARYNPAL
jgi:hypothetical protein